MIALTGSAANEHFALTNLTVCQFSRPMDNCRATRTSFGSSASDAAPAFLASDALTQSQRYQRLLRRRGSRPAPRFAAI